MNRRTLQGTPWSLKFDNWLQGGWFPKPYEPPGVFDTPLPWNEGNGRTDGASDGKLMPTAWYLVRANEQTGGVYLAGYDGNTKKCVGYIGQKGLTPSKPSPAQQFDVPKSGIWEGFDFVASGRPNFDRRSLVRNRQIFGDDSRNGRFTFFQRITFGKSICAKGRRCRL